MQEKLNLFSFTPTLFTPLLIAGCGPSGPQEAHQLVLDPEARERASFEFEDRTAWRVDAGRHALELMSSGETLRLGVLTIDAGVPIEVQVFSGENSIFTEYATRADGWYDTRTLVERAETYRIEFASDAAFWILHCAFVAPANDKPDVLLFLVDTLRPDRLGCYGYARDASPILDEFANHSVRFTRAFAQSSWIRASVALILTSTYPGVHGAEGRPDVLRTGLPSLAAAFHEHGYATVGINTNINLQHTWGFGGGFDRYLDLTWIKVQDPNIRDQRVIEEAKKSLDDLQGVPTFTYAHIMAPHMPYGAPPPFDQGFDRSADEPAVESAELVGFNVQYDRDAAYGDHLFGKLLAYLRQSGAYDNTVIAFVSDHGEQLNEHGRIYAI